MKPKIWIAAALCFLNTHVWAVPAPQAEEIGGQSTQEMFKSKQLGQPVGYGTTDPVLHGLPKQSAPSDRNAVQLLLLSQPSKKSHKHPHAHP